MPIPVQPVAATVSTRVRMSIGLRPSPLRGAMSPAEVQQAATSSRLSEAGPSLTSSSAIRRAAATGKQYRNSVSRI